MNNNVNLIADPDGGFHLEFDEPLSDGSSRHRRVRLETRDRREAEVSAAELARDLTNPAFARTGNATLVDALALWLRHAARLEAAGERSAGYVAVQERHATTLARVFGENTLLRIIQTDALLDYIGRRRAEALGVETESFEAQTIAGELETLVEAGILVVRSRCGLDVS